MQTNNQEIDTVSRSCSTCKASCESVLDVGRENDQSISIKGDPQDLRSQDCVGTKSRTFCYVYGRVRAYPPATEKDRRRLAGKLLNKAGMPVPVSTLPLLG